jgi:hypothetical protein
LAGVVVVAEVLVVVVYPPPPPPPLPSPMQGSSPPSAPPQCPCISFISPESVLLRKDVFRVGKFLQAVADDVANLLNGLEERFPGETETLGLLRERHAYLWSPEELQRQFYSHCQNSDVDKEFDAQNNFQTSVRGLKIRGVYESLPEARQAAERFRTLDCNRHDVYVSQVGCWCPWQPDPEGIQEAEYLETQLNTLMKSYHQNAALKDQVFQERLREKAAAAAATAAASS